MASIAVERIPIATLHPSLPTPSTKSITAVVTILWPYSSSTRTCALLLAEPDFRLRRRRGQVRVQFFGDAAYAVATSQLGIGDKVGLKLGGVQWLQSSGEEEVVRTPGKSVDWELGFRDRLQMLVTRDGRQFANVDVQRSTPEPAEEETEEESVYNTPSKIVGRFSAEGLRFNTWSSPAFLKRGRLSGESLSDYDLFADEDDFKSRKRRRTAFKDVGVWTYATRTPSPEKGDAMSVDDNVLASPSERASAPGLPALELPNTPISARMTPAEVTAEQEEELVPEPRAEASLMQDESERPQRAARKDTREGIKEQDDALYKQYLEDTVEADETIEVDEFPDEPEDGLAAQFSIQDARIIQGDSEAESLPSVIPDEDEAVPSVAVSVHVEDFTGDTEHDSDIEELEVVEMSSTEADSEAVESEHSEYVDREENKAQTAHPRLSTTEEDTSEEERVSEPRSITQRPEQDQASGAPVLTFDSSPAQSEIKESRDEATEPQLTESPLQQQPSEVPETLGAPLLGATHAAPMMPPPVLPQAQLDTPTIRSPAKTPPIGPVNAPSTPQLQPITSSTLPLPSPFPVAVGASSYMDARPSISTEEPIPAVHVEQGQHEIRPATAMSVAQAAEEALKSPEGRSNDTVADSALRAMEEHPNHSNEQPQHDKLPSSQFQFGLDGANLSAIRASRSGSAPKAPDTVDLQDTQLYESGSFLPPEGELDQQERRDSGPAAEQATEIGQELPDVPTSFVESPRNRERRVPEKKQHMKTVMEEESGILQLQKPEVSIDVPQEKESPEQLLHSTRQEARQSQPLKTEGPARNDVRESNNSVPQGNLPFSDDAVMPVLDDDWDMPDVEASEAGSTPKAVKPSTETREGSSTPMATPQKRKAAPSASLAAKPPVSSSTEIVDLGSDSADEEDQQSKVAHATTESDYPLDTREQTESQVVSPVGTKSNPTTSQQEPSLTQESVRSSLAFSPPQTRRRTRQSTIETVSQADTNTPSRIQRRSLRSSQGSRAPRTSQGASGVAARVAQRRRRTEVKDSECEWESNATISTQHPSSPPAPSSDGPVLQDFEPSAGLEASQVLGDLSQMEQQAREESLERPTVSPITPAAQTPDIETSIAVEEEAIDNPHEVQNRRLQSELEGQKSDEMTADRSSSPFPELNFEWGAQKKKTTPEMRPAQSSMLQDDFDRGEPAHSSMLQDDSSILRAMRTSQFPFETQRERQTTSSVADEDESQQTAHAESQTQLLQVKPSKTPQVEVASSPKHIEEESQIQHVPASPGQAVEETQLSGEVSREREHMEQRQSEVLRSSPNEVTSAPEPVTSKVQTFQESNVLTPDASQEATQAQHLVPKAQADSILPPTPRLTQATSAAKSFSQVSALSAEAQAVKPSVEQRERPSDNTNVDDITTKETTLAEATQPKSSQKSSVSRDIKWTPSPLSQGTRTSFSYFTPLTHLDSYTNSQSSTVDVLAVCTRPSKPPVRASAGPRDYHTLFSITDPSLANAASIRVQVFRPWKAALPELEPGDAVLLRAFLVRSRKGRPSLLSGNESAWCVFRYGAVRRSAPGSQEVTDAEGEGGGRKDKGRKKSGIADSMKPIWADHLSGLWGDVTGGLWGAVEGEAEDVHHLNGMSGATREEVHGPPVEFGDEERREAKRLREWWVGVGGKVGGEEVGVKVEEEEKGGKEQKEESVPVKDFFRSFW